MNTKPFITFYFGLSVIAFGQINPSQIEIIRDTYGVPHIYAATDAEVAYGLAWAQAEDDFQTIQTAYLAGNALLSKKIGLKGASADFLTQFIGAKNTVHRLYNTLSPEFIKILEGYCLGMNAYAEHHPKEVILKELFPLGPKELLAYTQLQLFISNGADQLVSSIVKEELPVYTPQIEHDTKGSNLIAISRSLSGSDETFLAINTHQPLEGPMSWLEAHLVSEEGTNIIGATFPGAPCLFTGANESLGWTHTVNYPDKADAFSLEMDSKKKDIYFVDGKAHRLEKHKAKVYVKLLGIPIPVKKKYYSSIYGPTLKNSIGTFSVRTPSTTNINAVEQWWRMNKAQSFSEFYQVLKMNAIPGYNIGYADRNDTIFYISNGKIPIRNEKYDWTKVVPGNTMATLWDTYYNTEDLPQVISPKSGFVYNANHSPFKSTGSDENPRADKFSKTMNYETYDNNRSTRLLSLLEAKDTINYEQFKTVKYDHQLPTPLHYNFMDINVLFEMNPSDYPDVADVLKSIQQWDRKADANSFGAGSYAVLYYQLGAFYNQMGADKVFTSEVLFQALQKTKVYMITHFGKTSIQLGDFQQLVRGDKELPIYGLPDVVTAMRGEPYKNGRLKITHGESYIGLVRFTPKKTYFESVLSYGNSRRPESPHYDDQMEMYANFKTKTMSFDKADVLKSAVSIYNPQ